MSRYSEYFLNSSSSIVLLDLLEIYHPNFSPNIFRLVRNKTDGVQVKHAITDTDWISYSYYPLLIKRLDMRENLDNGLEITFGDLGQVIPQQMDILANIERTFDPENPTGYDKMPLVMYRCYRHDQLDQPLAPPIRLEVEEFTFGAEGVTFEAKAKTLNISQTGEVYTIERFQMLRGFV